METVFEYLIYVGLILVFIGSAWMLVASFQTRWTWGVGLLCFPPLTFAFLYKHPGKAAVPAALLAFGLICLLLPAALTRTLAVDLGPYSAKVDGELHLTLTGWDQHDYRVLSTHMEVAVLQMANADVTDETLKLLEGMPNLKELDVANSAITDAGLASLTALPLERLNLANCAISDAGFSTYLASSPSLKMIDVRGTAVTSEAIRNWRKVDRSRRAMFDQSSSPAVAPEPMHASPMEQEAPAEQSPSSEPATAAP